MTNELNPAQAGRPRLGIAGRLARFTLIGVALRKSLERSLISAVVHSK
jgi:hypothetical protein